MLGGDPPVLLGLGCMFIGSRSSHAPAHLSAEHTRGASAAFLDRLRRSSGFMRGRGSLVLAGDGLMRCGTHRVGLRVAG